MGCVVSRCYEARYNLENVMIVSIFFSFLFDFFPSTAIGSGFGHFANIFLSVFIAGIIADADECQWYCLTYMVDSTLGTFMNLVLLRCFELYMQRHPDCTVLRFGEYGNPPQLCICFPQLVVWMVIVIVAKIFTMLLLFQFLVPLDILISALFRIFDGHPELELVAVMIIIPTIMNTMQFWVTDTFLKRRAEEDVHDTELDEELITGVIDCHMYCFTRFTCTCTTDAHTMRLAALYILFVWREVYTCQFVLFMDMLHGFACL